MVTMGTWQALIPSMEELPSVRANPVTATQKCEVHITYSQNKHMILKQTPSFDLPCRVVFVYSYNLIN